MRTAALFSIVLITPSLLAAPPPEPLGPPDRPETASTVQEELRDAKAANVALEKTVRYLEGQLDALRSELERARATEESLRARLADAELGFAKVDADRESLREERARLTRENAALRDAKVGLEARLAAVEPKSPPGGGPTSGDKRAAALAEQQEALTGELRSVKADCAAAQDKVTTLTWANDVLTKELDAAFVAWDGVKLPKIPTNVRAVYVVGEGESLSAIAKLFYGDSRDWQTLLETNAKRITDPDLIEAGTPVLVPRR